MATEGAIREGWAYYANSNQGPRYNNTLFRGVSSVTGSLVVTIPLPVRSVVHAIAGFLINTATPPNSGLDPANLWCGSYSGNTFTIYVNKFTSVSNPTLIASTHAVSVEWMAWCTLSGVAGQGEVTS